MEGDIRKHPDSEDSDTIPATQPRGATNASIQRSHLDESNARLIFFERVDVHLPLEDYGMECSVLAVADLVRGDRSHAPSCECSAKPVSGWSAVGCDSVASLPCKWGRWLYFVPAPL
jgi:hypothetical protein